MFANQNGLFSYQIGHMVGESEELPIFDKRIELPPAHQHYYKPD